MTRATLRRLCLAAGTMVVAGCGGTTRIVPTDPDQYQMTVYTHPAILGSGAQLLARAWQQGADLCAQQGKVLRPVAKDQDPVLVDRTAYAQMNFRCVDAQPAVR